jgi:hypothetical protein
MLVVIIEIGWGKIDARFDVSKKIVHTQSLSGVPQRHTISNSVSLLSVPILTAYLICLPSISIAIEALIDTKTQLFVHKNT